MPDYTSPSAEDRFADALDALTLGVFLPDSGDMSLVHTARSVAALSGPVDDLPDPPVTLDRTDKRRIWADLMQEFGGAPGPSPVPQSPGAAGSTLAPNPWRARPDAQSKRPRPSTGSLRFIPAAQPASTFLLIVAALVLVGGTFATLAPNGDQGVFRTAMATEHPSQLTAASPEASPVAAACAVDPLVESADDVLPDPLYRAVTEVVPEHHEISVANHWEQIVACGPFDGVTGEIPLSMMTDRLATKDADSATTAWIVSDDEARAILGFPFAWNDREEMYSRSAAALEAQSGFTGDPLALDADLGIYRQFADGRIALHSGAWRLADDGLIEPAAYPSPGTRVTVHLFAQQDRQWLYDETLLLCIGTCEGFETTSAPKPQLTIATPEAADRQWYSPLMNKDCALSAAERAATPPARPAMVTDPADYVPFTEANEADQIAAATTYLRVASGCEAPGDASLVAEGGRAVLDGITDNGLNQSQIDTAQAITEELGYTDDFEILIANEHPQTITDGEGIYTVHPSHVLLPDDVVQLPDGRLGGMARIQVLPEPTGDWEWYGGVATLFVTFDKVDGQWAMAESFVIFVGRGHVPEHHVASPVATPAHPATPGVDAAHARGGLDVATATPSASRVATPIE